MASNVAAAITACNGNGDFTGATASYTSPNTYFTATDTTAGTSATTTFALGGANDGSGSIFAWAPLGPGSNGTSPGTCSGSGTTYTGTFPTDTVAGTLASGFQTALNNCAAAAGFGTSLASPTVTITNSALGVATYSTADSTYAWSSVTAGNNGGAPACGGTGTNLTGTYQTGSSAITVAGNLVTRITACGASAATLGLSTTNNGNGTFTVTETYPGLTNFTSAEPSFTWATTTAGTYGLNSCPGITAPGYTGTFATSNTAALIANSLANAIQSCNVTDSLGLTVGNPTAQVTVAESIPGVPTFSSDATFTWGVTTPGSNGTATCNTGTAPNFTGTYVTGTSAVTVAGNLATEITACNTANAAVGMTAANSGTSTVTVTDTAPGASPTFTTSATNNSGIFSWGSETLGVDAGPTCTGASSPYTGTFINSSTGTTLATNFYNALNTGTCAASVGYTVTSPTSATVMLTDGAPGSGFTFSGTGGNDVTWTPTPGTPGSASCALNSGTAYQGQFVNSATNTTLATNFNAALNTGTCPANVGYSTGIVTSTVTLTSLEPGISGTLSASGGQGVTWTPTAAVPGTASCATGTAPNYGGQYVNSATSTTLATNLSNALTTACKTTLNITATPNGSGVTISDNILGAASFNTTSTNNTFSWSAATAGSNGGYTCNGSFTATYATSTTAPIATATAAVASNVSSAISTCGASTLGITSTYSSGSTFPVTAGTAGTGANGTGTFSPTTRHFAFLLGCEQFRWWHKWHRHCDHASLIGRAVLMTANATGHRYRHCANRQRADQCSLYDHCELAKPPATLRSSTKPRERETASLLLPCDGFTALTGGTMGGGGSAVAVGAGQFPAKYSFSTSGNGTCDHMSTTAPSATPDYVVYSTGAAGSGTQANIIAYDNIYSACNHDFRCPTSTGHTKLEGAPS